MKKILSILLLFISVAAISQPSNYLNIRSRYNLIAVKTDSGFHVPGYSTIPNYRGGVWTGSGNVGVDTVNNKFYFYSGGAWREAGSTNYADSLRRSGLSVQMRKNGNWTTQFNDSIGITQDVLDDTAAAIREDFQTMGGSSIIYTNSSAKIKRIEDSTYYTAFSVSMTKNDTIHIFASQGETHTDRMWVTHYYSTDGGDSYTKKRILDITDTSMRDCGGGIDSDGKLYLFVTKYTYTSTGNYATPRGVNLYTSTDGINFSAHQYNIPIQGGVELYAYGKMIEQNDTLYQTFYSDNNDVMLYKAVPGGQFSFKSIIYNGANQNNETCIEAINSSTQVAFSRTSGLPVKMFLSHNQGSSWVLIGDVGTANNVSPWVQKIGNEIVYSYADRTTTAMFLRTKVYSLNYLDTATGSNALAGAFIRDENIYEPILNNRSNVTGAGGHFGYPSFFYNRGRWNIALNDLSPLQVAPYTGDDNVTVQVITIPYRATPVLKAYNSSPQNFATDATTRITLSSTSIDTYGVLDKNNNIIVPHDGYYYFSMKYTVNTSTGGRRILLLKKVNAADTASTTNYILVIYREVSTGAVGTYQTLEASGIYYFQKGEVLKPCVQIWGASGDVSTVFTQSPGGTGEGIYNCVEMYQILL